MILRKQLEAFTLDKLQAKLYLISATNISNNRVDCIDMFLEFYERNTRFENFPVNRSQEVNEVTNFPRSAHHSFEIGNNTVNQVSDQQSQNLATENSLPQLCSMMFDQ